MDTAGTEPTRKCTELITPGSENEKLRRFPFRLHQSSVA